MPRDSGIDGLGGLAAIGAGSEPTGEAPAAVEAPAWDLDMGDAEPSSLPAPAEDPAVAPAAFDPDLPASAPDAGGEAAAADEELSFDPERFSRAGQAEAVGGIEEFLAAQLQAGPEEPDEAGAPGTSGPAEATASEPGEPDATVAMPKTGFSGLSLADDDTPVAPVQGAVATPAFDLDRLGGGLSLADPDSYGHGPVRGVVVIEAGLGGPDAVRQLLAGIPEGFARPILIRLALDGGRYDRLVKQMARATAAPVSVAEEGQVAQPGHVYFVPPGLGLTQRGGWQFDPATDFDLAALPGHDSAVLFLSGADAALVGAVSGPDWSAGLVLGQTPDEGCYDPAGAQAAIVAGAGHGTPAALAARLLARWPSAEVAPDPDPSGMLQP
ncbi:MAG TPA: chemotaxis protein CheB [Kiloniellaceae bacterium]|nr:chemotaxis protein CheB [Kiloniellaceae bacterium]